ncbi:MAG: sugar phosphate isomerase/epimerase [Oscillospiraceae bacterium]|nr:sugar phosphate isomerase/epimerase [Oscillospiraceae bacterium]
MLFGNCISHKDISRVKILKELGFDYVETLLAPMYAASKAEIDDFSDALEENAIKCKAVNVLFPGDIRLTGESADFERAGDYIKEIFEKTKRLKFDIVVFGSGGARKVPEGFDKATATGQLIELINSHLLPAAEKHDFTLVIEELNKAETNILNYIGECEKLVKQVKHPRVKLLADLYHIGLEADDVGALSCYGETLAHCHIANPYNSRFYPKASDGLEAVSLYNGFFDSLRAAGYAGGISIEGALGGLGEFCDADVPEWVGEDDRRFFAESQNSLGFLRKL